MSRGRSDVGGLDRHDMRTLLDIGLSGNVFEPIEARVRASEMLTERLVRLGLVEKGPCSDYFATRGYLSGYRVSGLGRYVIENGRYPPDDVVSDA
jgi:hypothetical protein